MATTPTGKLLDAKQIAERLNVSVRLAHELMQEMNPVNVSSKTKNKLWRVIPTELEAWIIRRTRQPDYGKLEIVPPPRRKRAPAFYTKCELTPEGLIPYRHSNPRGGEKKDTCSVVRKP
jgi:hypothetical protein